MAELYKSFIEDQKTKKIIRHLFFKPDTYLPDRLPRDLSTGTTYAYPDGLTRLGVRRTFFKVFKSTDGTVSIVREWGQEIRTRCTHTLDIRAIFVDGIARTKTVREWGHEYTNGCCEFVHSCKIRGRYRPNKNLHKWDHEYTNGGKEFVHSYKIRGWYFRGK